MACPRVCVLSPDDVQLDGRYKDTYEDTYVVVPYVCARVPCNRRASQVGAHKKVILFPAGACRSLPMDGMRGCAAAPASPLSPPLVLFADGCTRSTAVLTLAKRLLTAAGVRVALDVYEPMICKGSTLCHTCHWLRPCTAAHRPVYTATSAAYAWARVTLQVRRTATA